MGQDLGKTSRLLSIRRKGRPGRDGTEVKEYADPEHANNNGDSYDGPRMEGIEDLMAVSKFTREELQRMYRGFKNECPNGCVDKDIFKKIYSQFFPYGDSSQYAQFIFNTFDTDKDGKVSFEDFVIGLSISLHGLPEDKMKWTFQLYDLNGDGVITREELAKVIHSVNSMMGVDSVPLGEELSVEEHVERLFELMDINRNGVITEDEFIMGCQKDETIKKSLAMFDSSR